MVNEIYCIDFLSYAFFSGITACMNPFLRPAGKKVPASLVEDIFMESEKSVLATLDFLDTEGIDEDDDDDDDK